MSLFSDKFKIIEGVVDYDKRDFIGKGFTVRRSSKGVYELTFDHPFKGSYLLNVQPILKGDEKYKPFISVYRYAANGAIIHAEKYAEKTFGKNRKHVNFSWSFIAIGNK